MASFQAKISWERPRKREKKNRSDEFLPVIENSKKIVKNSKNQKTQLWLLFEPKYIGDGRERGKIKKKSLS